MLNIWILLTHVKTLKAVLVNKSTNSTSPGKFFSRRNFEQVRMSAKSPDPKLSLSRLLDTGNSIDKALKAIKEKRQNINEINNRESSDPLLFHKNEFKLYSCKNRNLINSTKDEQYISKFPRIEQEKCELRYKSFNFIKWITIIIFDNLDWAIKIKFSSTKKASHIL